MWLIKIYGKRLKTNKQANKHAHMYAHAVLLVWGELRFAPNMQATVFILVASQLAPTLTI